MQTTTTTGGQPPSDLSRIAQDLQIRKVQVEHVVQLLDDGNTVPFIARFRKEQTNGLGEDLLRKIQARIHSSRQLAERKQTILKSIETQGKLSEELSQAILAAETQRRLDDLYLPYRSKKISPEVRAAIDLNLEPLAIAIWSGDPAVNDLDNVLTGMVDPSKNLNSVEEILAGAKILLAQYVAELPELRGAIRHVILESGKLLASKAETVAEGQGQEFRDYFAFSESVKQMPPHRILAVNRGEREKILKVKLEWDHERVNQIIAEQTAFPEHPHRELIQSAVPDAIQRVLVPALESELRRDLTEKAQEHAVSIFARNLRSLLLQPPLEPKRVLAIDPGLRNGCKIVAMDQTGAFLEEATIYPHAPQNKKADARRRLEELIRKHQIQVIAIGNGTACRETEQLVADLIADIDARRAAGTLDPFFVQTGSRNSRGPKNSPAPVAVPAPTETPVADGTTASEEAQIASEASAESTVTEVASSESSETPEVAAVEAPATESSEATAEAAAPESAPAEATASEPVTEPTPEPAVAPPAPEEPRVSLPHPPEELAYVIVNEAGATDYANSAIAREELPMLDPSVRATLSIGRRLQDPLRELVKNDPQHVGVGLYQHDVRAKHLKESLEGVVESCVNYVGVDLNDATAPMLRHISGLNQVVAREIVDFRAAQGPFKSREALLQIPSINPHRYNQAIGFLKISGGEEPLDATWVHPEQYELARRLLADAGFTPADLFDAEKLQALVAKLAETPHDELAARYSLSPGAMADFIDCLIRPGYDPRQDLPPPIFKKGLLKLEDLTPNMELKGTVLNVVDFGAFVDIGLKDSGLVHISQMANRYIKSPYDVVAVGDVVTVWVMQVDADRRRVSLTMIEPGTERKPPERGAGGDRRRSNPEAGGDRPPRREGGPARGERRDGQDAGPNRGRGPRPGGAGGPPNSGQGGGRPPMGGQRPGAPRPFRAGRPSDRGEGDAGDGSRPAPPPRKPAKPRSLPNLSDAALKGKAPLHTFGELEAFFKAKDVPGKPETPPANDPPAAPPESETPPAAE